MAIDKTREAAFQVILKASEHGAYSNLALKTVQNESFTRQDRAFATSLVYGTISMQAALNHVIAQFSSIPLKKISPKVLAALQLGIYQLLYMDRVPESAACNTTVDIAKRHVTKSAGFVNAILRTVVRSRTNIKWPGNETAPAARMAILYSYPEWMVTEWMQEFGEEFTEGLLAAGNGSPPLTIRTNTLKTTPQQLCEVLITAGANVSDGRYLPEALNLLQVPDISSLTAFKEGLFQVQDESAMLVAAVVDPKPGDKVLDLCSAPGGKATHLAEKMGNQGLVLACDIHDGKLGLVAESAQRLGIDIIKTTLHDATQKAPPHWGQFDAVLVDAPCSGTGIIRRKPDIKWHRKPSDIFALVEMQQKILYNAGEAVKHGGTLVYSTCAIGAAENDAVVDAFLAKGGFEACPMPAIHGLLPEQLEESASGRLHLYPNRDGSDGFFIARFRKTEGTDR